VIFLDTGPLIAFFNRRDCYHQEAKIVFEEVFVLKQFFVTTNRVVSETYDAIRYDRRISSKKDAKPALLVFEAIEASKEFIKVEFVDEALEQKAKKILKEYPDQNFSFTDATSFAFIEKKRLKQIFTFDFADFSIYHFQHTKAIQFYPPTKFK